MTLDVEGRHDVRVGLAADEVVDVEHLGEAAHGEVLLEAAVTPSPRLATLIAAEPAHRQGLGFFHGTTRLTTLITGEPGPCQGLVFFPETTRPEQGLSDEADRAWLTNCTLL